MKFVRMSLKKAGQKMKRLFCGKKFILLSHMRNLKGKVRKTLQDLLAVNSRLYKAYLLKEIFGDLWSYRYKGSALKFW